MVPLLNAAGSNGGEGGAGTGVFVHGGAPTEKDAAFTQYVDEGKRDRETKDGDRYIVATERDREIERRRRRRRDRDRKR